MKKRKDIIEKARQFVKEECKKPSSIYGYEPYPCHFIPVHNYAKKLAEELNANVEVVEIAAWLHDIGSVIKGRKDHHITGAEIAEKKLRKWGYDKNKIKLVKKCILNHRGSVKVDDERKSIEEQIIAEADAMNHFDRISGLFMAAFISENKNAEQGRISVKNKIINSWNKLSLKKSKSLIKEKYEAAMLLLE